MMDETPPPMNPVQELTERALQMRKRAKVHNAKDAEDAKRGIIYQFRPDPHLAAQPGDTADPFG